MKYGGGKSDGPISPKSVSNKGVRTQKRQVPAERQEARCPAKDNPNTGHRVRTQSRAALDEALARIREFANNRTDERFTALFHHVYDIERLRQSYGRLRRDAASGVDFVTWHSFGQQLEENLAQLSDDLRNNAYRPSPVRRVFLEKTDGKRRPIGIPTLRDKIVQGAMRDVLQAIYETMFLPFSHGSRPNHSQHDALDALAVGLTKTKVNWVLDADLRGFFDTIDQEALVQCIEQRVADKRVLRLIRQWMEAGVLVDGEYEETVRGVAQGNSISPLLANIYLHYVFDEWLQQWRRQAGRGDVIVSRYVDDFIVGFQHEATARQFQSELTARLTQYGLQLHPDKTRLIAFGRYATERRARKGQGKPETFDYLGFTHVCGTDRRGQFSLRRYTSRKKLRGKLQRLKVELRKRAYRASRQLGGWLRAVVIGHYNYYGVPLNLRALARFRDEVTKLWRRALLRLSQKAHVTWEQMNRLAKKWLPKPKITHPYPDERLHVTIRGRSPVR